MSANNDIGKKKGFLVGFSNAVNVASKKPDGQPDKLLFEDTKVGRTPNPSVKRPPGEGGGDMGADDGSGAKKAQSPRLNQVLVERGVVTKEMMDSAIEIQK